VPASISLVSARTKAGQSSAGAPGNVSEAAIPKIGLDLPRALRFENWVHVGRMLATSRTSLAWCLGDWLVYGEETFAGRYRDAVELVSLDYQTLRNYAWVVRRFPLSRRREALSFGHHAEVASLPEPEQEFWLRKAEDFGWSRNRLRSEVRASLRERTQAIETVPSSDTPTARRLGDDSEKDHAAIDEITGMLLVPNSEQDEKWNAAARRAHLKVEVWAARTLDDAADHTLPVIDHVVSPGQRRHGPGPRARALWSQPPGSPLSRRKI
jgi:hypothetical protein